MKYRKFLYCKINVTGLFISDPNSFREAVTLFVRWTNGVKKS